MRVLVFSDSHGLLEFALRALKEAGPVDLVLHAGDHYRDGLKLAAATGLPVKAVAGNCDRAGEGHLEELLELVGHRVLLLHGHTCGPRQLHERILTRAAEAGAHTVVFGHTHAAYAAYQEGVLLFNPGSITTPRDGERPSYGLLEVGEEGITPHIYRI